ncbi:M14 family metallopeptidase [Mesorhizobium australicum]|uniref:M14 family metallopeptidase n=1 Tax=Mesorhizobium australicum TaxID=536018 RepID=UPI00333B4267
MSTLESCFSVDYQRARLKFRDAATQADAVLIEFRHPGRGPNDEVLSSDVAIFGDSTLPKLVVVNTGLHGVEGLCGSGCLVGLLEERIVNERSSDTAVLLVHALNPYGFAHLRRVDEDNVDLNRNFVNHKKPFPKNDEYRKLHGSLLPECWEGPSRDAAESALRVYAEANGYDNFISAVTRGQYEFADGLFFGGRSPAFSNSLWRRLLSEYGSQRERVCVIDIHSGLGPRGYGEIQFERGPLDPEYQRAQTWYRGAVTTAENGSSSSAAITGYSAIAVSETLPTAERTCVTLEYGTVELEQVLSALRGDHWLHARASNDPRLTRDIKQNMRDAYCCDEAEWKRDVAERAVEVFRWSLHGLSEC